MSIAMTKFASEGNYLTYDPFRAASGRVAVFVMQCRCCGYEAENPLHPPKVCPKCRGESWERYARPGSILENASREN